VQRRYEILNPRAVDISIEKTLILVKETHMSAVTLVTALFDLSQYDEDRPKTIASYKELCLSLLKLSVPTVVFCDSEDLRTFFHEHASGPIDARVCPLHETEQWKKRFNLAVKNDAQNPLDKPNKKDTVAYRMLQWMKFHWLKTIAMENPFETSSFAWIDAGIGHVATPILPDRWFSKFSLLLMRPVAKFEVENLSGFLRGWRGKVGGGFLSGSQPFVSLVCNEAEVLLDRFLEMGFAPMEDQVLALVHHHHPDWFRPFYGDYQTIFENYTHIHNNLDNIVDHIEFCLQHHEHKKGHAVALHFFLDWRAKHFSAPSATILRFFQVWTKILKHVPVPRSTPQKPGVKIILNIMQHNEASTIQRCLKAALPIVDAVAISNTYKPNHPVEDTSLHIIRDTVPLHIPLSIESEEWQTPANFGHNRTLGLQHAREMGRRLGWNPQQTYLLLLDADMELRIGPDFDKNQLIHDEYAVEQCSGGNVYWNTRLLKAAVEFEVVGRTHEHYAGPPHIRERLQTLIIDDHNDGGNRGDKYTRDEESLLQDLLENPKSARSMFYLAETYRHRASAEKRDLHHAITYYQRHNEVGAWEEEMWYSQYAIGLCYQQLKMWTQAIDAFLIAYQRRPHRAEPLFRIGKYYRDQDQHWLAMLFLQKAREISFPKDDLLFVEKNVYDYEISNTMAISAFYTGQKQLGHDALEHTTRQRGVPWGVRHEAYFNARFYIAPLPGEIKWHSLQPKVQEGWRPCNPSLTWHYGKLLVLCRVVNYSQRGARNFKVLAKDGIYRTKNVLMVFDENLRFEQETPFDNNSGGPFQQGCQICGWEDARIVNVDGDVYFSTTSLEHLPNHTPSIVLGRITQEIAGARIHDIVQLRGHHDDQCQKNWLPFATLDGSLRFVYGYDPFTILEYNAGDCQNVKVANDPVRYTPESSGYRGSSGPVVLPDDQGMLILVHEVCDEAHQRTYMHRFLWFDSSFTQMKGTSNLFFFRHKSGVEMATGMTLSLDKKRLLVTVGIEDEQAWLGEFSLATVLEFIQSPCVKESPPLSSVESQAVKCTSPNNWWQQNLPNNPQLQQGFLNWVGDSKAASRTFVRDFIQREKVSTFLDCGCGLCVQKEGFDQSVKYTGLDITPFFIEQGRSKGINVLLGSISDIPVDDGQFEVVHARHVLEHLDLETAIRAFAEMIRVASRYVIIVWFILPADRDDHEITIEKVTQLHHNRYSKKVIEEQLRNHHQVKSWKWFPVADELVLVIDKG